MPAPVGALRRARCVAALLALSLALIGSTTAASPLAAGVGDPIIIRSEPIDQFQKNTDVTRFGALIFLGGLQFSSSDSRLQGISAIRLDDAGNRFIAVTDNGNWLQGRIERDGGKPKGFADATISPLRDLLGRPVRGKAQGDAESLAIDPDGHTAYVGFEQRHRIWAYDLRQLGGGRARDIRQPIPVRELRANKGLEALALAPSGSPLDGAMVAISEHSVDGEGHLFAGIVGKTGGVFKVKRDEKWEVSDGAFMPGGDLLLLERRFEGLFGGLGSRIRRVPGASIRPGALVDGPVVFEADLAEEIDNMEGLDVWQDADGRTRLTLISDDNGSMFQRNILLEFVWSGEGEADQGVGQ